MDNGTRPGSSYVFLVLIIIAAGVSGYAAYALYPRFDLPQAHGAALLLLAAGAGVASFFSPCAFPLLVALLARETAPAGDAPQSKNTTRALAFATALAAGAAGFLLLSGVLIAIGGAAAFNGVTFTSIAGRTIRAITGAALIGFGLVQLGVLSNPLRVVGAAARPMLLNHTDRPRVSAVRLGLFGFAYLLAGFG